ncbi:MAG: hypothetical protein KDI61_03355, partial [Alphaproteobacteria bacterium]|nr:hypothetical protein [Alphaproteobacteria bacterium]
MQRSTAQYKKIGTAMKKLFSALLTALALAAVAPSAHAQEEKDAKPAPEMRLYHLDCGNITVT